MLPKRELQRLLEKWKKVLRLSDWFIVIKVIKSEDDETIEKSAGRVGIIPSVYEAKIELNAKQLEGDVEMTIIHELAHIQVKTNFKPLRDLLEDMEPDDSELLEDILDSCEEEQVRHIEFLMARIRNNKRYLPRKKEKKDD